MRNLFAMLGIVSLIGMVIPNWVILIDQIETEIANGRAAWMRSSSRRSIDCARSCSRLPPRSSA